MIFFVKFCSRDCNMSSTISTNSVVFRAYKAFLCPFDAIHSFSDSLTRDESPEQAWLVQGCHVLPHSCLVLSQKEDRASGISRCQWPALADFNRFLVTLWRQVCSRQEQCTFWGWLPGSEEAPSQLIFPHTWNSNHLQLKGFIWHKIQYGCGNTKLQRQRKEKEPWFYLMYN